MHNAVGIKYICIRCFIMDLFYHVIGRNDEEQVDEKQEVVSRRAINRRKKIYI